MLFEPVLMGLDGQGADQAQTALRVGKDPHHLSPAFNFFVQALEHVGALEMLMVLAWEAVEAKRFFEVLFNPGSEPRVFTRPSRQPGRQIAACFSQIAAGVEPAPLLPAVVVALTRYVVQSVAEEMDIAALPDGFWQDFANGRLKPRMIVGDYQLHAVKPACLESAQEVAPARAAFPVLSQTLIPCRERVSWPGTIYRC